MMRECSTSVLYQNWKGLENQSPPPSRFLLTPIQIPLIQLRPYPQYKQTISLTYPCTSHVYQKYCYLYRSIIPLPPLSVSHIVSSIIVWQSFSKNQSFQLWVGKGFYTADI